MVHELKYRLLAPQLPPPWLLGSILRTRHGRSISDDAHPSWRLLGLHLPLISHNGPDDECNFQDHPNIDQRRCAGECP